MSQWYCKLMYVPLGNFTSHSLANRAIGGTIQLENHKKVENGRSQPTFGHLLLKI